MKQSCVAFVEGGESAESTRLKGEQQQGLAGPEDLSEHGCRQDRAGKGRLDPAWHRGGWPSVVAFLHRAWGQWLRLRTALLCMARLGVRGCSQHSLPSVTAGRSLQDAPGAGAEGTAGP